MLMRRVVAISSLVLVGVSVVAQFLLPQYATWIFYGVLLWMMASFLAFYGRPIGRPSPAAGPGDLPPAPGSSGPPRNIDFCVYCGTPLGAGLGVCPACGKVARPI